jgi:hypothetical protein
MELLQGPIMIEPGMARTIQVTKCRDLLHFLLQSDF